MKLKTFAKKLTVIACAAFTVITAVNAEQEFDIVADYIQENKRLSIYLREPLLPLLKMIA